jgi:hypothetical protein
MIAHMIIAQRGREEPFVSKQAKAHPLRERQAEG